MNSKPQNTAGNALPAPANPLEPASNDFAWINNDSLLRDEGALYGIAAADITDKLNAIRSYYQVRMAPALSLKTFLDNEILRLSQAINSGRSAREALKKTAPDAEDKPADLLTTGISLAAIAGVSVVNYFLVAYWLAPVISSGVIIAGIYLLGLFSVLLGRGIFSSAEQPGNPSALKTFLIEYSIPAAVAFFICTLTAGIYPTRNTIAAFLLFSMLFLTGKVLLRSLGHFKLAWYATRSKRRTARLIRRSERSLDNKLAEQEQLLQTASQQLRENVGKIQALDAEQQYKTDMFLSEYKLASQSRQATQKVHVKQLA